MLQSVLNCEKLGEGTKEPRVVCWRPHLAGTRQYMYIALQGLLTCMQPCPRLISCLFPLIPSLELQLEIAYIFIYFNFLLGPGLLYNVPPLGDRHSYFLRQFSRTIDTFAPKKERWGPYLQSCQWGFNMRNLKLSQILYPLIHCENTDIYTCKGPSSVPYG